MSARKVTLDDLDWLLDVLRQRREPLVPLAPIFWRPSPNAAAHHRAFLQYLLTDGGAKALRTDSSVLVASPRGGGWLVDDMHVPGDSWASGDGGSLWAALAESLDGAEVRFVCPTYEGARGEFAKAVGLGLVETWWLRELEGTGGEAGQRLQVAGVDALTVPAPPVYAPPGPILYLPAIPDVADPVIKEALERASELGCAALVVNVPSQQQGVHQALTAGGLRAHCDYYAGAIRPV